jgi:hypothetical protein
MAPSSEFTSSSNSPHNPSNFEDRILILAELLRSQVDVATYEKAIVQHAVAGFHARGGLIWKSVREDEGNVLVP